jgi:hypothetical protein
MEPSAIYRFKQELRALADVSHPNIALGLAALYAPGHDDGAEPPARAARP